MMTDEQWERWAAEVLEQLKQAPPVILGYSEEQALRREWELRMVNPNDRPLILGSPQPTIEWRSIVAPAAEVLAAEQQMLEEGAWRELQDAVKAKLNELITGQERCIIESMVPSAASEALMTKADWHEIQGDLDARLHAHLLEAQERASQYRDVLQGELLRDDDGNLVYKVRL